MSKSPPAPPPPPPDYTQQKAAFSAEQGAARQGVADQYNAAVGTFNQQLRDQGAGIGNLRSTLGGLTIADLHDGGSQFQSQVDDLRSGLTGLSFDRTKPSFSGAMMSPFGSVSGDVPTLNNVNEGLRSNYLNEIGGLSSRIDELRRARTAEETRVNDFRSQAMGELGNLSGQIGRASIGNEGGINSLASSLDQAGSRITGFNSPITSQLYGGSDGGLFPTLNENLASARSLLSDLEGRRAAELDRIENFRTAQQGNYDQLSSRFAPLTIANEQGLSDLARDIDTQQLGINRFRSEIGTDFNPTLNNLFDLEGQVSQRQAERESELSRIQRAEEQARAEARGINATAESANMFSLAGLNAIGDRLDDAQTDLSGFSSILPFDFGAANERLAGASGRLSDLRADRASAIDDFLGRASTVSSGLSDIADFDEAGLRSGLSELQNIGAELSPFSGGRVADVQAALEASRTAVDARMEALNTERNNIEAQAQQLLEAVGGDNFSSLEEVAAQMDALGLVEEKQQLFAAAQALDEIDSIRQRLQGEKQRLETDNQNSAAALNAERNSILGALGPDGVPQFQDFTRTTPMTAQEYLALLARQAEEEDDAARSLPSGFSGNLGVIQV